MTPAESPGPLRTFGFGDLEQDTWLAGWFPAPGTAGVLLVASGDTVQAREAQLSAGEARGEWRVSSEGAELVIAPTSQPAAVSSPEGEVGGYEQGAELRGQLTAASEALDVALPGRRGERPEAGELTGLDSVRELAAWFGPSESIAVMALRPRKHKGQEQDRVQTAVVDPEAAVLIIDPRLSSTSTAAGRVRRVGLELWTDDEEEQPPLRLAGEALHRGASLAAPGWELTVDWLACHRRGRDGAGVYLLARPV